MNEYKKAGVDVEAGYESVERIKKHIERTKTKGVLSAIGGFGGLFELDIQQYQKPVLVSGTDGVGTKLKIAQALDIHHTIGIDCVAMCVNDIVCSGAQPLFFLDYIACGKNQPEKIEKIVQGVADGCEQANCAIVGGETAEMPGMYDEDEYDIAGFAVGIVEKHKIIDQKNIQENDILIGLASSGVHSNGFSLVRKIFGDSKEHLEMSFPNIEHVGKELLKPTRIYVDQIMTLLKEGVQINGISHITGGGFVENIPRMIPDGLKAVIYKDSWPILPIFPLMQKMGSIKEENLYNIFNMGIGCVMACKKNQLEKIKELVDEPIYEIGKVEKGRGIEII